jgi:adenylate cyclase
MNLLSWLLRVPSSGRAPDEEFENKRLFLAINLLGTSALIFLAAFFSKYHGDAACLINAWYAVLSLATYVWLRVTGRGYPLIVTFHLIAVQVTGAVSTLSLGGFAASGHLFVWSLLGPLAAIVFARSRMVLAWIALYLALLAATLFLHPAHAVIPPDLLPAFSFINVSGASALITAMLYHAARQLRAERAKSEELLLNILPEEIAAVLKRGKGVIADYFPEVSILFADVVGFTPISAQLHPVELVKLLNEIFSYVDTLVEKYGLEKIKTIGDCYMIASGVPRPREDHAQALARFALDMRAYAEGHAFAGNRRLQFRMGINSGPVVAGVIGRKKFIYDLWGDAVNVASRMESHGQPGAIQITEETYRLLRYGFVCEPQGTVKVKGKGEMPVWHLTGERPRPESPGASA